MFYFGASEHKWVLFFMQALPGAALLGAFLLLRTVKHWKDTNYNDQKSGSAICSFQPPVAEEPEAAGCLQPEHVKKQLSSCQATGKE